MNQSLSQSINQPIDQERIRTTQGRLTRGPFLESPDNFSGPESYFMCAMFALKTQILLVLKAD